MICRSLTYRSDATTKVQVRWHDCSGYDRFFVEKQKSLNDFSYCLSSFFIFSCFRVKHRGTILFSHKVVMYMCLLSCFFIFQPLLLIKRLSLLGNAYSRPVLPVCDFDPWSRSDCFGVWSGFISRSVRARLQVSVCIGTICFTLGNIQTHTDSICSLARLILLYVNILSTWICICVYMRDYCVLYFLISL